MATFEYNMQAFQTLLQKNVVEVIFNRRHHKPGWSGSRGAFITTNWELLNSDIGDKTLNFKPPKGVGMSYDHRKYNLVVGWDLFRQDWRVFGVENSNIRNFYDVSDDQGRAEFWLYLREYIMKLSSNEKLVYMGYIGKLY